MPRKIKLLCLPIRAILSILAFSVASPAVAAILHVPTEIPEIQPAIDLAASGDTIYVAPGIYTGTMNKNLDFFGKDLSLIGVGGSEQTVIDCELEGRAMKLVNEETSASLVQGFTMMNGYLDEGRGGGILCYCDVRFVDIKLVNNTAPIGGGLLTSYGGSPALENVLFHGNLATDSWSGGGAEICNDSHAILSNVTFLANEGGIGGGLSICGTGCNIALEGVIFEDNISRSDGGGLYQTGSTTMLQNCLFIRNHASGKGGGMWLGSATLITNNCRIEDNTADQAGGGICAEWDEGSQITNTLILNNTAGVGGAIFLAEYTNLANTVLRNVTIAGNRSTWGAGAAIYAVWQAELDLEETLITANYGGGALFTYYGAAIYATCNNVFGNPDGNYECNVLMGRYGQGCDLTAVQPEILPGLVLEQNHPNPFNPKTEIRFTLPEAGMVSFRIFDLAGRLVRGLLAERVLSPGIHSVRWDGMDDADQPLPSGIYLYRMEAAGRVETRKMTLLR